MRFMRTWVVLSFAVCSTTVANDRVEVNSGQSPQVEATNLIFATVIGGLSTRWDTDELHYASVQAGGAEIELDPAGCPKITRELIEYHRTAGGAIVTDTQVEARGYLVFEKRPDSADHRGIRRGEANAVVPVLRVRSVKITILPLTDETGSTKRAREPVESSTVRGAIP